MHGNPSILYRMARIEPTDFKIPSGTKKMLVSGILDWPFCSRNCEDVCSMPSAKWKKSHSIAPIAAAVAKSPEYSRKLNFLPFGPVSIHFSEAAHLLTSNRVLEVKAVARSQSRYQYGAWGKTEIRKQAISGHHMFGEYHAASGPVRGMTSIQKPVFVPMLQKKKVYRMAQIGETLTLTRQTMSIPPFCSKVQPPSRIA